MIQPTPSPGLPSPRADHTGPWFAARALAVMVLLLASSTAFARLLMRVTMAALPRHEGQYFLVRRQIEEMHALPEIVDGDRRLFLLLGSSLVERGFAPRVFDGRARELGVQVTSYNLGISYVDHEVERLIDRRVCAALGDVGHRAALTALEFMPFQATYQTATPGRDDFLAVRVALLADAATWWAKLRSPSKASQLFGLRLLGGDSPQFTVPAIRKAIDDALEPPPMTADRALIEGVYRLDGLPRPAWNVSRRGEDRLLFPETRASYAKLTAWRTRSQSLAEERQRVGIADLAQMRFEETRVAQFIEAARALQPCSISSRIVVLPRNTACFSLTSDARARLEDVLARIERETGLPVINLYEAPEFSSGDFEDCTHLNELSGKPVLSALLADRMAGLLRATSDNP